MYEPKNINGPQRNRVLIIGAICGKACALAQVAVESTHWQAQISVVSSVSGDIWLLLRRKLLLGATPRSAKGVDISRGFQSQANSPRPGVGAYGRKIKQVHRKILSFGQNQGLAWSSDSSLWGNQVH